jgi:hypothetical protein
MFGRKTVRAAPGNAQTIDTALVREGDRPMISAQCPMCREVFSVRDQFAGRPVECHNCGTPTIVPHVIRGDAILTAQGRQRLAEARLAGKLPSGSVENTTARAVNKIIRMLLIYAVIFCVILFILWYVWQNYIPPLAF